MYFVDIYYSFIFSLFLTFLLPSKFVYVFKSFKLIHGQPNVAKSLVCRFLLLLADMVHTPYIYI